MAIEAGMPIVLHLRQHTDSDNFKRLIELLLDGCLFELPHRMLKKRQNYFVQNFYYKVVEYTSLLWDDINRSPITINGEPINHRYGIK